MKSRSCITATAFSDAEGNYQFLNVRVGSYSVRAELQGFSVAEAKDVSVTVNARQRVDLTLTVGNIGETIEVIDLGGAHGTLMGERKLPPDVAVVVDGLLSLGSTTLAVRRAFTLRGWRPETATPEQCFVVACSLGANRQHIVSPGGYCHRQRITPLNVGGNRQRPHAQVSVSRSAVCRASAVARAR